MIAGGKAAPYGKRASDPTGATRIGCLHPKEVGGICGQSGQTGGNRSGRLQSCQVHASIPGNSRGKGAFVGMIRWENGT